HAARVRRLALRERVALPVRGGGVEAAEVLVQRRLPGEGERRLARRQAAREGERRALVVAREPDPDAHLLTADPRRRARDLHVGGMEGDLGTGLTEGERDADLAREAPGVEIGSQVEVVEDGTDVGREA